MYDHCVMHCEYYYMLNYILKYIILYYHNSQNDLKEYDIQITFYLSGIYLVFIWYLSSIYLVFI